MAEPANLQERLRVRLRMRLAGLLDEGQTTTPSSGAQRHMLEERLRLLLRTFPSEDLRSAGMTPEGQERLIQEVLGEGAGFGPLDALLADPSVSEIMVNGPHEIFIEREGHLERLDAQFRDANHLMATIERMLGSVNQSVNETTPVCDASLLDGSRINVIVPPLVLNGPVVTIRRKLREWSMQEYVAMGALSQQQAEFLEACVRAKVNLVISGGTSTGKTTLVSILSEFIPPGQRIITIENVAELELPGKRHWIRLVSKQPNLEGRGEIPLRALVKNALRMRPDRIVLGESRGGEAIDMVQAMHSGHDGFITVLHANSPRAALERLETLMLMSGIDLPPDACRMQIASAVDLVVHLSRFADGSRRIGAITQVLGTSQGGFEMEDLFLFRSEGFSSDGQLHGSCQYTGAKPKFFEKFHLNNIPTPTWVAA